MNRNAKGFTLIELMIVVAVVAILAAIAIPSYSNLTRKARRADAMDSLTKIAMNQERYYNNKNRYSDYANVFGASDTDPIDSEEGFYVITVTTSNGGSAFTAVAVAQGDQANDVQGNQSCANLSLTNTGLKSPVACW